MLEQRVACWFSPEVEGVTKSLLRRVPQTYFATDYDQSGLLTYGPQGELEGVVITGRMRPANQFAKRRRVLRTSPQLLSLKAECHKFKKRAFQAASMTL